MELITKVITKYLTYNSIVITHLHWLFNGI